MKSLSLNEAFTSLKLVPLAVLLSIFASFAITGQAAAQDIRYQLGGRLRTFEQEFEKRDSDDTRKKVREPLEKSVSSFFSLQLGKAAAQLDQAACLLQNVETLPKAASIGIKPNRLLFDSSESIELNVEPVYGKPDWIGMRVELTLINSKGEEIPLSIANEGLLSDDPQQVLRVQPKKLPNGDYLAHFQIRHGDQNFKLFPQAISIVEKCDERLANLETAIKLIDTKSQPTQVASLKYNLRLARELREGERLETDYPGSRILQDSESALTKIRDNKPYWGEKKPGEFWLNLKPSQGKQSTVRLLAPLQVEKGTPLPLVIALHGAGGSENMFFDAYGAGKIVSLCKERGWLLIAPKLGFTGTSLSLTDYVTEVDKLYPVNKEQVFVVGHSMGAAQAIQMTGSDTFQLNGLAILGGGRAIRNVDHFSKVKVFVAAGEFDFGRSGAKAFAKSLKDRGVPVDYREYADIEHLAIVQVSLEDVFRYFESK